MADVDAGLGDWIAENVDMGPELDEVIHRVKDAASALAAGHTETGAYEASLVVAVDTTSKSKQDRILYSDDPAAISIEWGHVAPSADGAGQRVPGQHIMARAADSVIT